MGQHSAPFTLTSLLPTEIRNSILPFPLLSITEGGGSFFAKKNQISNKVLNSFILVALIYTIYISTAGFGISVGRI